MHIMIARYVTESV